MVLVPTDHHIHWDELIDRATGTHTILDAEELVRGSMGGSSKAFCVRASDGGLWVLKGSRPWAHPDARVGRTLFNDQVVGRLAQALGAPVPRPALVRVTPEFIAEHSPELKVHTHGLFHGSTMISGEHNRIHVPEEACTSANRLRFAFMAVLFGWVRGIDHQETILTHDEGLIWSIDHNLCMGGKGWTVEDLHSADPAGLDEWSFWMGGNKHAAHRVELDDLRDPMKVLRGLNPASIALAVAASPDEWKVEKHERVAVAEFLWQRRSELIAKEGLGELLEGMIRIHYVS